MKYRVIISVDIRPEGDQAYNSLFFNRGFQLSGDSFSDIATRVDALVDAIDTVIR